MSRELKLTVNIKRSYGAHSVEFGISEVVTVSNGQERRDAYANLLVQLDDQIKLYETAHLQDTRLPKHDASPVVQSPALDTFPAQTLVVEFKNNKRHVSLKGGRWQKFGVPLYPDSCASPLDIDSYDYGLHDLTHLNLTAQAQMNNGKPQRVVSLS